MVTLAQKMETKLIITSINYRHHFLPAARCQRFDWSASHSKQVKKTWCSLKIPQNQARDHTVFSICYHGDRIQLRFHQNLQRAA